LDSSIKILNNLDLDSIVKVHVRAFPSSALTKLGKEAVRRYYHWILNGPHEAYCIGLYADGRLGGYCFSGKFKGALTGFLRKNRKYLAWRIASHPWLITNPLIIERLRLASNLLGKKQKKQTSHSLPSQKSFGILAIAVDPDLQGKGIGKEIMQAVEEEARHRGFVHMHLSVEAENEQAIEFYRSIGWEKVITTNNIWSGRMQKLL
jgi:ribosomal protein S18 acetylase RimI-like enzyme